LLRKLFLTKQVVQKCRASNCPWTTSSSIIFFCSEIPAVRGTYPGSEPTACAKQYIAVANTTPKITLTNGCAENVAVVSQKLGYEIHGRTVNIHRKATRTAVPVKIPAKYGVL
jgi:hypothetical protein